MFRKSLTVLSAAFLCCSSTAFGGDIVETAVGAGSFKTLVTAVKAAGLVETLQGEGPFTVFAPSDEAFAKLPQETIDHLLSPAGKDDLIGILTYHVVAGDVAAADVVKLTGVTSVNGQRINISSDGGVKVDGATIVSTDIECSNGVIHVIDSVILPESKNIVEVASNAGSFGTLLAAADAAGLVEVLSGEGPLTVFAPTDEAFSKLPAGTLDDLLKPENKGKLAAILKYHVVAGRVYSDAALEAGSAKTLEGQSVHISVEDAKAKVNEAALVATDIDASNGVIHVIDSVILPPAEPTGGDSVTQLDHSGSTNCEASGHQVHARRHGFHPRRAAFGFFRR
ncbi:MAG: fasciclin domain-containing protein [Planctomycetaceae bacterium]